MRTAGNLGKHLVGRWVQHVQMDSCAVQSLQEAVIRANNMRKPAFCPRNGN